DEAAGADEGDDESELAALQRQLETLDRKCGDDEETTGEILTRDEVFEKRGAVIDPLFDEHGTDVIARRIYAKVKKGYTSETNVRNILQRARTKAAYLPDDIRGAIEKEFGLEDGHLNANCFTKQQWNKLDGDNGKAPSRTPKASTSVKDRGEVPSVKKRPYKRRATGAPNVAKAEPVSVAAQKEVVTPEPATVAASAPVLVETAAPQNALVHPVFTPIKGNDFRIDFAFRISDGDEETTMQVASTSKTLKNLVGTLLGAMTQKAPDLKQ
ncbi:hypothetical protein HZA45_00005, partial [Candidatus Peregrinibacteria bacterium]|nr:hypothetical protein [Candidatus Peregrinibacteria bacterium]